MAALKELESKPERLVLGRGGQQAIGSLVSLVIFGALVVVGLSSMFEGEGPGDVVGLITSLIFGLIILGSVVSAARSTRVIVDAGQRTVTRNDLLLFLPLSRQELHFNGIKNVRISWIGLPMTMREEGLPFWRATVEPTSGAPIVLNQQGTHGEMAALADKVAQFVNRPVADELTEAPARTPAPTADQSVFTPSGAMASLVGNLVEFAQSAQSGYPSPPIVAPTRVSPSLTDARETRGRGTRARRSGQARTPSPPSSVPDTATPPPPFYADLSAMVMAPTRVLAQTNVQTYETVPLMYSAPPLMVMPELPLFFSFPPALEVPSLPPILGDNLRAQATEIPEIEEIKEVDSVSTRGLAPTLSDLQRTADAEPTNAQALYQLARSQHALRAFNAARTAYERALRVDPVNAAAHNDLGVLYYQQGNLNGAEKSFHRALALDPFAAASRYNLGLVLARTRRERQAHEQFTIGQQNAYRSDEARFEQALRGIFGEPMPSPEP